MELSGDSELTATLAGLRTDRRRGEQLVTTAADAGTVYLQRQIESAAPDRKLQSAIGRRRAIRRGDTIHAKTGINVGRKRGKAPWGHLRTLGTARRQTKAGANRGRIRPNTFLADTTRRSAAQAVRIIQSEITHGLNR